VLEECPKKAGILTGQTLIGVFDEAALGGRGVVGDVRAGITLAASRAVDVEFGDVDGQPELFEFRQRRIFNLKTRRRRLPGFSSEKSL
jgi:hypothetical protein